MRTRDLDRADDFRCRGCDTLLARPGFCARCLDELPGREPPETDRDVEPTEAR